MPSFSRILVALVVSAVGVAAFDEIDTSKYNLEDQSVVESGDFNSTCKIFCSLSYSIVSHMINIYIQLLDGFCGSNVIVDGVLMFLEHAVKQFALLVVL
jgi:hypothetical protein